MSLRFLDGEEMQALRFAIGESEELTIEECYNWSMIARHFLTPKSNFMFYDTGERKICLAWVLGDEQSFVEFFVHEEVHRVLHETIDLKSCCMYDNIAQQVEAPLVEVLVNTK
jgi:hypothetical protein